MLDKTPNSPFNTHQKHIKPTCATHAKYTKSIATAQQPHIKGTSNTHSKAKLMHSKQTETQHGADNHGSAMHDRQKNMVEKPKKRGAR